ncbi:MAG: type ISP restriction/modification enzyme, partial [Pyrinomonadaceae bacterium]
MFEGNIWLAAVQQNRKDFNAPVVGSTTRFSSLNRTRSKSVPLWLRASPNHHLFGADTHEGSDRRSNLSEEAKEYVRERVGIEKADALFYHIVAILYAPAYAMENAGALRQDWPRIPLPATKESLIHSSDVGRQIAALLDTEIPVDGVTAGTILDPFISIGVISHIEGRSLKPDEDLKLTKNWGYRNKAGAIMPGGGKTIER